MFKITKKILFVTYGGGHVNTVLPIAKKLKKSNDVLILALTTAKAKCLDAGLITKTFYDYSNEETNKIGEYYANLYHRDGLGFNFNDTKAYYGCSMRDLINDLGMEEATKRYNEIGRKSFLPIETLEKIIDLESPDLIITTNSPRAEYAALIAAKRKGIPSLMVVDLFGTAYHEEDGEIPLSQLEAPDVICVMHDSVKKRFVNRGVREDKIVVTGQPAFDCIKDISDKYQNINEINLNKKKILFASQQTSYNKKIIQALLDICNDKGYELSIKLHPSEKEDKFDFIQNMNFTLVPGHMNVHDYIITSDIVVLECSTVGLEAILMNKPLVTVNLSEKQEIVPYGELGLSYHTESLNDLSRKIELAIINGQTPSSKTWINDGNATEKIINRIHKMLI